VGIIVPALLYAADLGFSMCVRNCLFLLLPSWKFLTSPFSVIRLLVSPRFVVEHV
jgi:hypothetical protein